MRFNRMIYFSRTRLETFFPEHPARRLPLIKFQMNFPGATVGLEPATPRDPSDVELQRLRQVRRDIERGMSHFYAPNLKTGDWIYFDLEMGWSTSHEDSDLPDLDDVLLFYGSLSAEGSPVKTPVDLMLCGSTEHLLKKTATAGRMGSGTEWLHKLILKINQMDAHGDPGIPEELAQRALAVPRVDQPERVCRDVFSVIARHHAPHHRGRVRGLAQVELYIPDREWLPRLIVAAPLYVQDSTKRTMRWITRLRLQRDLSRRYGMSLWKWHPDLPPRDRGRYYIPPSAAGH